MSTSDPQAGEGGMLRGIFARFGRLLLTAERAAGREPKAGPAGEQAWSDPADWDEPAPRTADTGPGGPVGHATAPQATGGAFRPLGQTGNVRLLPPSRPVSVPVPSGLDAQEPVSPGSDSPDTAPPDTAPPGPADNSAPAAAREPGAAAEPAEPVSPPAPGAGQDLAGAGLAAGPVPAAAAPSDHDLADAGALGAAPVNPAISHDARPADADRASPAQSPELASPIPAGPVPAAGLPVPDYDSLSLPSLRARLRSLDVPALQRLLDYERAHAGRENVITMYANRIAKISGRRP